ncbi:MAG: ABC transporter permease [Anaerolineae bacterium]|nr:ABC transporter permease [Anaerolineae bacterium]
MNLRESCKTALRSLRGNKVRSALTMLGIIIGVGAVVALMSIGQGVQASIVSQIQSMGTNLLFVSPGAARVGGVSQGAGSAASLTYEDALAIADKANCPSVALVAPEVSTFAQIVYRNKNVNARVSGVTAEYAAVRNLQVAEGQFISPSEVNGRSAVAVLGAGTAGQLFEGVSPIGQTIRVDSVTFRVIGVLASKGGTGLGSQDDVVLVPLTTAQTRLTRRMTRGEASVSMITVQVVDRRLVDQAIEEISNLLRRRHRVLFEDDFTVSSQEEMLSVANQVTGVLTLFLGGIAAISLLVGGIGIMNIMLVSVTERTREIGIRKAVGARHRDILGQFLVEATLLSIVGGLVGIALGWAMSRVISALGARSGTPIATVVTPASVLLAVGFSIIVGLFFGVYPAVRAAALRPIDALRYE